jgi:hypothetical protein
MGKTSRTAHALPLPVAPQVSVSGHRVGTIVGFSEGCWSVEFDPALGPVTARTTLALEASAMQEAATQRRSALLAFENESAQLPIVVGLIAPPAVAKLEAEVATTKIDALVDGKRVSLDARDEIVLRCGQASITLRRNGRVVIRGTYVETRAQGTNRIKGGDVRIN